MSVRSSCQCLNYLTLHLDQNISQAEDENFFPKMNRGQSISTNEKKPVHKINAIFGRFSKETAEIISSGLYSVTSHVGILLKLASYHPVNGGVCVEVQEVFFSSINKDTIKMRIVVVSV